MHPAIQRILGLLLTTTVLAPMCHTADQRLPGPELNLRLDAPISTWDEAVPLGNGTMGVLLWGEGNLLRLSLDRGDLWDERPSKRFTEVRDQFNWAAMQRMVAENDMGRFHDVFDSNYDYNGPPTKLPAGRVEITLDPAQTVEQFELNLATAEGVARFRRGSEARLFVDAANVHRPVAVMRIPGAPFKDVRLKSPESVKKLGYEPPRTGEGAGLRWFEQEAADGFAYAICVGWKRAGNETLLAVTVATSAEGTSPQAVALGRVEKALEAGYDRLLPPHAKWWADFWSHSRVHVPEPHILRHYSLVRYFYGAASRRGAPPMPLQGVWSADAGTLPPWKGDYHNDLNTQMTYLAYRTSGDNEAGLCFLDYLWDRLPTFRQFARDFYDAPGAAVPGVMSLAGQPLGGWGQYSLSPTMGAWNAHLFYLHWRHTGDAVFLRERAYPFCREIGECLRALLKPDANGVLVLPLSSSPEIFDNTRRAFLKPNTNYDLASIRMLFLALAEMAAAVGEPAGSEQWLALDEQLGDWHLALDETLLLDESTPLPDSHRHLSNLMPLHPFNLITADGGGRDRRIIAASLKDWASQGTQAWCGYSFSWMACLRARVGDAETALRNLDIYARAFILRNGFHANGDQTKTGFSGMTYRPFTLEGNFLAMDAVHEMLLQSWNSTPGTNAPGLIRLFPATPWRWHDASFEDLRAEGGHRVSARRESNATTWFRIVAGSDGLIRVRDNFGGRSPQWSRAGVRKVGDDFEFTLQRGEALEATLPTPSAIPSAPANAAEPVVIRKPSAITPNKLPLRIGADSQGNKPPNLPRMKRSKPLLMLLLKACLRNRWVEQATSLCRPATRRTERARRPMSTGALLSQDASCRSGRRGRRPGPAGRPLHPILGPALLLCWIGCHAIGADDLAKSFREPPDVARPGVYWYFMDGNLSRDGMTRDLESMKAAGLGHLVFLEVNVGVPRGPVDFLSEEWQDLFAHAVREAERLGIEITLGSGPGWTGSGGPWVKPEQSMQHLVASKIEVQGPGRFEGTLPVPPPHRPFFGDVPARMRPQWEGFFKDVAVLAFPTPATAATIEDIDEKSLVYRAPFSSQSNVKPRLEAPAAFPVDPPGSTIPLGRVVDLTQRLKADGTLDWEVPEGRWTVMRFVSRNNGASTRPAPEPGIGFECDKFDPVALDAHFDRYIGALLKKVGPRQPGRGWTMLHMDSWEMGAQNWTPRLREEFRKRRGYDPLPFYPAYDGLIVGSREQSERFLWDLRLTGQELVIENHAEHLKRLGRENGFTLSIEPYDMNPVSDFDLGAVADVPMCEFWSLGYNTTYSCHTASSIAHVLGLPVVAAEAFTGAPGENWRFHPGSLKNQGDWAFATGINRLTYHTFAHKPDESRPGMVMGPYGVHWDRGQTWWPMVGDYHRYITRCQHLLRQGRTVADVLYLMPEGAPNVFQPPSSAFTGSSLLPDRRGYNFDACSANALLKLTSVREGQIVFPGGATYRLLVLPNVDTMTPELLRKVESLVRAGASVVGNPPRKSPSLVDYPACDDEVTRRAAAMWGSLEPPAAQAMRRHEKGRILWGEALRGSSAANEPSSIPEARWIWQAEGNPVRSAPVGRVTFRREFTLPANRKLTSARLEMTADNRFAATLNGAPVLEGDNFHIIYAGDVTRAMKPAGNVLTVLAENGGNAPNPAGLIGALRLRFADHPEQVLTTDGEWTAAPGEFGEAGTAVQLLGPSAMPPWQLKPEPWVPPLYPHYDLTAGMLRDLGVAEDFASSGPLRYTHRHTPDREVYFVASRSDQPVQTTATFRVQAGAPELWHPLDGEVKTLPEFTHADGLTRIPLSFDAYESYFVIFPRGQSAAAIGPPIPAPRNFVEFAEIGILDRAWDVSFEPAMGAPALVRFEKLDDWTQRPESGLKHYSGMATYRTTFDLPPSSKPAESPLYLDLGRVEVMARVRVNGTDCGVVWTAPRRVDISQAVEAAGNTLEIEVANLWPNRMIGDAASPERKYAQTTYRPFKAGDPLLPSGLLGPVRLLEVRQTSGE